MGDWARDNDSGSSGYSREQVLRVLAVLERHRGRANAISRSDLALAAHLDHQGRTLRNILRELDGVSVLLVHDDAERLLWVAESLGEADATTRKLEAMRNSLTTRINRRKLNAAALVAAPPALL